MAWSGRLSVAVGVLLMDATVPKMGRSLGCNLERGGGQGWEGVMASAADGRCRSQDGDKVREGDKGEGQVCSCIP